MHTNAVAATVLVLGCPCSVDPCAAIRALATRAPLRLQTSTADGAKVRDTTGTATHCTALRHGPIRCDPSPDAVPTLTPGWLGSCSCLIHSLLVAHCSSVCPGERSCRMGSIYGPANTTGCGVVEWWPHVPGWKPYQWCRSTLVDLDDCAPFLNRDACFASLALFGCGWCSNSTFGGGQCQQRNVLAAPAQPYWMKNITLPVCRLNATTGEPAYSFIDRCLKGSESRVSCVNLPSALGCGWCADGSTNPASPNSSCQAATAAGFFSGMTCAAESFIYPAAGYVDPCKRFSSDCESCSSAPAEFNCGRCTLTACAAHSEIWNLFYLHLTLFSSCCCGCFRFLCERLDLVHIEPSAVPTGASAQSARWRRICIRHV